MITPAYSATATERVLPRLALDFTTASLDSRVTLTRSLNTATRVNSSGLIETVNANLPRFDYDPQTLLCRGLLIEESRSNLILYSSDFTNVSWDTSTLTTSSNSIVSPDGTSNADALTGTATNSYFRQLVNCSINTPYTRSIWLKVPSGTLTVNIYATDNGTGFAVLAANLTTSWQRFTVTATSSATATQVVLQVGGGNTWGNGVVIHAWGGQIEAGAFATSYIPTEATSLTRNADVVSMTGTNFSDWFNATEGAFEAEYSCYVATNTSNSKGILAATDGTTGNRLYMNINTAGIPFFFVSASSSTQANISTGVTLANDAVARTVASYKLNSFAAATNGTLGTPDTVGNVPTVNRLDIGSLLTSPQLNGHFRKLMYWPQRITNSETQAFSK